MTHLFDCEVAIDWDFDHMSLYEYVADRVLDMEKCPYEACVSLLLTGDEQIRQINRENRNIDKSTDVLSFPLVEYKMPSDFICIDSIKKTILLNSGGNKKAYEKIFIPKHQEEMYKEWKLKEGGFLFYV